MGVLGVAVVSALPGLVNAGLNYATMAKQKSIMDDAEKDAAKFISDARDRFSQNAFDELQVPLEAYRQGMREVTAQQNQAVEALQETGARGILGGIGSVQASANKFTQNQQNEMAKDIYQNELLQAQQENRNIQNLAGLDVAEARGAQAAAGAASFKRDRAREGVYGGLASGLGAGLTSYAKGMLGQDAGYEFADEIEALGTGFTNMRNGQSSLNAVSNPSSQGFQYIDPSQYQQYQQFLQFQKMQSQKSDDIILEEE